MFIGDADGGCLFWGTEENAESRTPTADAERRYSTTVQESVRHHRPKDGMAPPPEKPHSATRDCTALTAARLRLSLENIQLFNKNRNIRFVIRYLSQSSSGPEHATGASQHEE
jgi:hypothetical protein